VPEEITDTAVRIPGDDAKFLRVPPDRDRPEDALLGNATRYLCAAAYLDPAFRHKAIHALLKDRYSAVAPSYGDLDVIPVLRHCLRAQRLLRVRNVLVALILLAGVPVYPPISCTMIALAVVRSRVGRRLRRRERIAAVVAVALVTTALTWNRDLLGVERAGFYPASLSLALLGAAALVILATSLLQILTVTFGFLRGSAGPGPRPWSPRVAARLKYVGDAQYGNLTLHEGAKPFLGSGIARPTRPMHATLYPRAADPQAGERSRRRVPIDLLDLHDRIQKRLRAMLRDAPRAHENLAELNTGDHFVAKAPLRRDGVLVGRDYLPVSYVTESGRDIFIPQTNTSVRHYQHVNIPSGHRAAMSSDGREETAETGEEIVISGFIHLTIDGEMLYVDFTVTVLPPITWQYQIVDNDRPLARALEAWSALRKGQSAARGAARTRPVDGAGRDGRRQGRPESRFAAHWSMRESAAEPRLATHTQLLDASKYVTLVHNTLSRAVIDYLDERGVETGAFKQQINVMQNRGIWVSGDLTGIAAMGDDTSATQVNR
jgi:hypothetical protein